MKPAQQTVVLYYSLSALNRFGYAFIFGTYVVFMMSRGMDLFQINLINMVYYGVVVLGEIPTGAVADMYGRKTSFLLASLLLSMAMFTYFLGHSWKMFVLAEGLAALGSTFLSGAFQAWLVDRLKYYHYDRPFFPIFARVSLIELGAGMAGAMLGSRLADKDLTMPWLVAGVIMGVNGLLAALLMKEEYFVRKQVISLKETLGNYRLIVKDSIKLSLTNRQLRFLLLLGTVLFLVEQAPNMQWQPLFKPFVPAKSWLGMIYSGISVAMMVGAVIAVRMAKLLRGEKRALVGSSLLMGMLLSLAGLLPLLGKNTGVFPAAISTFLGFMILRGAFRPLSDALINQEIPSGQRATLLSFNSMLTQFGGAMGLLLSGWLAERFSISLAWICAGGFLLIATWWLMPSNKA
jgi:MFS family permease